MVALLENLNVWNTCLRTLRLQGFQLSIECEDPEADLSECFWVARKGDYDLWAGDPIQLLGLASIHVHLGSPTKPPEPYWWVVDGPDIIDELCELRWPDDDDESYVEIRYCCEQMDAQLQSLGTDSEISGDYEGSVISYSPRFDEYYLSDKDGGDHCLIKYCPWCGAPSPRSKRSAWLQELATLGYEDPLNQDVPSRFKTAVWRCEQPGGSP